MAMKRAAHKAGSRPARKNDPDGVRSRFLDTAADLFVSGFAGRKGTFYADDVFKNQPIRVRTTYEPLTPDHAQWTQAFSPRATQQWEINWIMDFKRATA